MIRSALELFLFRGLEWSRFNFPRWQTLSGIAALSVLMALDPHALEVLPVLEEMPALSLGIAIACSLLLVLICILISVYFLKWWMKRGGRWDGKGDMFNLLVASTLVADILSAGFLAAGMPMLLIALLSLYSLWVGSNALSVAIPKASRIYSMSGLVLTLIPLMIISVLTLGLRSYALVALGATSPLLT